MIATREPGPQEVKKLVFTSDTDDRPFQWFTLFATPSMEEITRVDCKYPSDKFNKGPVELIERWTLQKWFPKESFEEEFYYILEVEGDLTDE